METAGGAGGGGSQEPSEEGNPTYFLAALQAEELKALQAQG